MSELADQAAFNRAVDATLDEHEAKLVAQDAKLSEHDRALAILDRSQKTFENLIELFRTGIREEFDRVRRELSNGQPRR